MAIWPTTCLAVRIMSLSSICVERDARTDLRDPASAQTFEVDGGEELDSLVRPALEGESVPEDELERLLHDLRDLMGAGLTRASTSGPAKLDKVSLHHFWLRAPLYCLAQVVTLNGGPALHATLLAGAVDISSTNKARETQVDLRKLEKAEAKIKAKADKRAKRTGMDLYEGSKLVDAAKAQVRRFAADSSELSSYLGYTEGIRSDVHPSQSATSLRCDRQGQEQGHPPREHRLILWLLAHPQWRQSHPRSWPSLWYHRQER